MAKRKSRGKGGIFKPTYKKSDGTVAETDWWHIRYTDAHGRQRKEKAAPTHGQAKEVLAFEATRITHGDAEAERAREAARALFQKSANKNLAGGVDHPIDMPTLQIEHQRLVDGEVAVVLSVEGKLCNSRNEARRLARQGGLYLNGEAIAEDYEVSEKDIQDGVILMRAGKKRYLRVQPV